MRETASILILGTLTVLLAGCSQISRPEQAQAGEQVNQDAFLHEHLPGEAVVTVAEAYRAMVMLAEGEDKYDSFAAREEYLLSRKAIRPEWKLQRDRAIDRGSVAYMVVQILKIRGGVNFNTFGRLGLADRHYALRELVYMNMMTNAPDYRFINGAELVDVMGNADAYLAKQGVYEEPPTPVDEAVEKK